MMENINQVADTAKAVLSLVQAINEEDFETARRFANDDFTFDGVMGSRNDADAYFEDMKKMKFKYDIKKVFADNEEVCLLCDIDMGGKTLFTCNWYHVTGGKVSSLKSVFDPRPLLEKK